MAAASIIDILHGENLEDIASISLAASLRDNGPRKGQERNLRLLSEQDVLQKILSKYENYLALEVQDEQMKKLTDYENGQKVSYAYYKTLVKEFSRLSITVWDPSTWNLAAETMKGLSGETFTYAMWKNVRPQIWAWDAAWPDLAWQCRRDIRSKTYPVKMRFVVVVPLVSGDVEDELPMVVFFSIMIPARDVTSLVPGQKLPYICARFLHVGEAIPEQSYYNPLYFLEQEIVSVRDTEMDDAEKEGLRVQRLRPEKIYEISLRKLKRKDSQELGTTYAYQWMVSGHIRRQYYPSTREYKMIFIEPYLKGDPDKPMMPFKGSLYTANR